MKITLTTGQKLLLVFACFTLAIIGFMIKLPPVFRHADKELHAAFYFLAAAFLDVLFAKTKLIWHLLIFGALYVFGLAIEYGQAYSNRFFHTRIHGRFDPEDVQWNLKGLLAFSLVWLIYTLALLAFRKAPVKNNEYRSGIS